MNHHATLVARRWMSSSPKPLIPPTIALPPYLRIRTLSKLMKLHVDQVIKALCTKENRVYSFKQDALASLTIMKPEEEDQESYDYRHEFRHKKEIIIPFAMAAHFVQQHSQRGINVTFDPVEPRIVDSEYKNMREVPPVVSVMGHVNHGKTTLLDTLRGTSTAEVEGITQSMNICRTSALAPEYPRVTFLDTPGHFHLWRHRNTASAIADVVILVIAADEGLGLQTREVLGRLEEPEFEHVPVLVVINKIDTLHEGVDDPDYNRLVRACREYQVLDRCPIVPCVATTRDSLAEFIRTLKSILDTHSCLCPDHHDHLDLDDIPPQGMVLDVRQVKGQGDHLRVLVTHGSFSIGQHFVSGFIHGQIRDLVSGCYTSSKDKEEEERRPKLKTLLHEEDPTSTPSHEKLYKVQRRKKQKKIMTSSVVVGPGSIVDVVFRRISRHRDTPLDSPVFILTPERASALLNMKELAQEFEASKVGRQMDDHMVQEADERNTRCSEPEELQDNMEDRVVMIMLKADSASSLASLQDALDEAKKERRREGQTTHDIVVVQRGLGAITETECKMAAADDLPIYCFNVPISSVDRKRIHESRVTVIQRPTIHGLLEHMWEQQREGCSNIVNHSSE